MSGDDYIFLVVLVILQVPATFIHVVSTFPAHHIAVRQKTAANCNLGDLECNHNYFNYTRISGFFSKEYLDAE